MTSHLILWGLPGYIAFYLLQVVRPARSKSGWDFVVEVGLLALGCFVVARGIVYYGAWLLPDLAGRIRQYWPREYSFTLALGLFPVAPAVGIGLAKTHRLRARWLSAYHAWITGKPKNFHHSDVFFATCDELLGEMALLTLGSGKVYVGILIAATQDPNESKRYIRFIPVLSGYRKNETQLVAYTTFYDPTNDPRRAFLLAADELSIMAPFDFERLQHFIRVGAVTLDFPLPTPEGDNKTSPETATNSS